MLSSLLFLRQRPNWSCQDTCGRNLKSVTSRLTGARSLLGRILVRPVVCQTPYNLPQCKQVNFLSISISRTTVDHALRYFRFRAFAWVGASPCTVTIFLQAGHRSLKLSAVWSMRKRRNGIKANKPKKASPIPKTTKSELIKKLHKKNHDITTTHEFSINNWGFGYASISIYIISLTLYIEQALPLCTTPRSCL